MIAVVLSPKARALIVANRDARGPTAADRERVTAALRARLGASELPLDAPSSMPMLSTGIQRRFAAAFGLCVVSSVLLLARRPTPLVEARTRVNEKQIEAVASAAATTPPGPASASLATPAIPEQKTASAPRPAQPKIAASPRAPDTLAQELALLTSAASQLNSGRATGALLALEEHQRRFSRGVLSDERNVAKARALCILNRFEEGRAALARLATGTPAAARVKEECDSAWARANTADSSQARESN